MTTVESHFTKSDPEVLATYRRLLAAARALGRITEEPKKTCFHLVRQTAFAGVATRRSSLVLTLKSAKDIRSPRIERREQASVHAGTSKLINSVTARIASSGRRCTLFEQVHRFVVEA
jgi:hypothetical protein